MKRRYHYRHRVAFAETNVVGSVYFAEYLYWQGRCREEFLADLAPDVVRQVMSGELALITLSCSMEYLGETYALEEIDVSMGLAALRSSRIDMEFEFARDGRLVARGAQSIACMSRSSAGMVPIPVPEPLRDALATYR